MNSSYRVFAALGIAAVVSLGGESSLQAQEATLSEIIVTAQKRAQNLQEVPIAITAVSSEDLADRNGYNLQQVTQLVPGLQFSLEGADVNIILRGSRGGGTSLYQDGMLRLASSQFQAGFTDTSRLEVTRGPAGTLNGRNSYAGAVNVVTNPPEFDATRFGFDATATNNSGLRTEFFVNHPFSDSIAVRLSAYRDRRDGVIKNLIQPSNSLQDRNDDYVRLQVGFKPSERLSGVLRLANWKGGGNGSGDYGVSVRGVPINPLTGNTTAGYTSPGIVVPRVGVACNDPSVDPNTASPIGAPGSAPPLQGGIPAAGPCNQAADPGPFSITRNGVHIRDIRQKEINGEVNWEFSDSVRLRGLFSHVEYSEYRQADGDYGPSGGRVLSPTNPDNQNPGGNLPGLITINEHYDNSYTEELQLLSNGKSRIQWVVGTFLLQNNAFDAFDFAWENQTPGQPGIVRTPRQFNTNPQTLHCCGGPDSAFIWYFPLYNVLNSKSLYGDAVYSVNDSLRVLGGIRYTRDAVKGTSKFYTLDGNDNPSVDKETFSKVTWRAGLEYDVAPGHLLYFTASTGFIAGGANPGGIKPFGEQNNRSYEIGSKNMFLDGTLRVNVDAYLVKYNNLLVSFFDPATSLTTAFNAGSSKANGIELEARWQPINNLHLGLAAAYTHSYYGDFLFGAEATLVDGQDLPAQYGPGAKGFIAKGLATRNAPKYQVNTSIDYDIGLGNYGVLSPGVDVTAVGKYKTRDAPLFYAVQDSYVRADLRVGWHLPGTPWSANAFMTNVGNKAIRIFSTPNQGGIIYDQYQDPRIFGVRFSYRTQ